MPASITLDRTFLFLIRDNPTGSVLFAGRVADPGAQ
jgi:serpin B